MQRAHQNLVPVMIGRFGPLIADHAVNDAFGFAFYDQMNVTCHLRLEQTSRRSQDWVPTWQW
jgi:hypothetical protein